MRSKTEISNREFGGESKMEVCQDTSLKVAIGGWHTQNSQVEMMNQIHEFM